MVDGKTNQLAWRGFNIDDIQLNDVDKDLADAANDVLKKFYKDAHIGVKH
jgi:hypothetical protein